MHAGLLRPDSAEAPAFEEARAVAAELADAPEASAAKAPVALVYDYASEWGWMIQPHGARLSYFQLLLQTYRGLRRLGVSVDIVPPAPDAVDGYDLVLAPGLLTPNPEFLKAVTSHSGTVVLGPRFGARTSDMATPVPLPPAVPGLDVTVARVESLRPGLDMPLAKGGAVSGYREVLEGAAEVIETTEAGAPVLMGGDRLAYLGGWLDEAAMIRVLGAACDRAGIVTQQMPAGVRCRDTATERFWFNYGAEPASVNGMTLPAAGVFWETR
jgi:beta-galactosidase